MYILIFEQHEGWIHLQHTRIAVAFASWRFSIVFEPIKPIKDPTGKLACVAGGIV